MSEPLPTLTHENWITSTIRLPRQVAISVPTVPMGDSIPIRFMNSLGAELTLYVPKETVLKLYLKLEALLPLLEGRKRGL